MKKVIYILIGVGVIALGAYILMQNKAKNDAETAVVSQKNTTVAVRTATVQFGTPDTDYMANGTFEPSQEL